MATLFQAQPDFSSLELIIDFIVLLDIFINFISETVTDVDVIIYMKDTTMIYLKTYFAIDVLSILPSLIGWEKQTLAYPLKALRFMRIKRFF